MRLANSRARAARGQTPKTGGATWVGSRSGDRSSSKRTVETLRQNILEKTGCKNTSYQMLSLQLGKQRKKKRLPEWSKLPLEVPTRLNVC